MPRNVAICAAGSRGDCQPYIALGLGLAAHNHRVRIFTSGMHKDFIKSSGLEFGLFATEKHKDAKEITKLHENIMHLGIKTDFTRHFDTLISRLHHFAADVILVGTFLHEYCYAAGHVLNIPVLEANLQSPYASVPVSLYLPGCVHWANYVLSVPLRFLFVVVDRWNTNRSAARIGVPSSNEGVSAKALFDVNVQARCRNRLLGLPLAVWRGAHNFDPPENILLTGYWTLDASHQVGGGSLASNFTSDGKFQALEAFLDAEEDAPVYMGWGSMRFDKGLDMFLFACRAAMLAGRRLVLVGGWGILDEDREKAMQTAEPALRGWILEGALFFTDKAPHEWLLPRCACTVHHGGAGTTAAALRAGVPTVITPIMLDQFDNSRAISRMGVGIGLRAADIMTPSVLAKAITRACSDPGILERAAKLGEELREEDGTVAAVREIDDILARHSRGDFKTYRQAVQERQRELGFARSFILPWLFLGVGLLAGYLASRLVSNVVCRLAGSWATYWLFFCFFQLPCRCLALSTTGNLVAGWLLLRPLVPQDKDAWYLKGGKGH